MVTRCPGCSSMVVDSMTSCPVCGRTLKSSLSPTPVAGSSTEPQQQAVAPRSASKPSQNSRPQISNSMKSTPNPSGADRGTSTPLQPSTNTRPAEFLPAHSQAGDIVNRRNPDRGRRWIYTLGAVIVVLIAATAVFLVSGRGKTAQALSVSLRPIGDAGPGPFTSSVVTVDKATLQTFAAGQSSATTPSGSAPSRDPGLSIKDVSGGTDGLYGVDLKRSIASGNTLAGNLSKNNATAALWASAMGVSPNAIDNTIAGLTPVVLTTDSAFTVHNVEGGKAGSYQAILQIGSVVFIDTTGTPVIDATSGNPLGPSLLNGDEHVAVHGDEWSGFDRHEVTRVVAAKKELAAIEGIDIQTGETTTISLGGTVTYDGFLVTDDHDVSIVSADGEQITQIIDHAVAAVFDDGSGGIVYQEFRSPRDGTFSDTYTPEIMWLKAATAKPTVLHSAEPGHVLQLFDVGVYHGKMTALIADSDEPLTDGDLPTLAALHLIDLSTMEDQVIEPGSFLAAGPGEVNSTSGSLGEEYGVLLWSPPRRMRDTWVVFGGSQKDLQVPGPEEYCTGSTPNACLGYSGVLLSDGSFATINSTDSVVVNVGSPGPAAKTRTIELDGFDPENRGYYNLEASHDILVASFVPNTVPGLLGTPQNAIAIDTDTWQTRQLPITGNVAPIHAPIIRPGASGTTTRPPTTNATTTSTTRVSETTQPATVPPTTTPPTSPAATCPTIEQLEDAARTAAAAGYIGSGFVDGCADGWAWGSVIAGPSNVDPDELPVMNALVHFEGGAWVWIDKWSTCEAGILPSEVPEWFCGGG